MSENIDLENKGIENRTCKNCQARLEKDSYFCQNCGQKTGSVLISIKQLVYDLFSSIFNIDNRFLRTLLTLLIPGKVSSLYILGKQSKFSNPIRFYLFLTFILFSFIGYRFDLAFKNSDLFKQLDTNKMIIQKQNLHRLDSLSRVIQANASQADYKNGANALLYLYVEHLADSFPGDTIKTDISSLGMGADIDEFWLNPGKDSALIYYDRENEDYRETALIRQQLVDRKLSQDSIGLAMNMWYKKMDMLTQTRFALDDLLSRDRDWIFAKYHIHGFLPRLYIGQAMKIVKDPGKALVYVMSGFSWVALLFIPLIALFLKILYIRRRRFYIEHLLFALHNTSFLFIIMILYLFLSFYTQWQWSTLLLLIFPFYLLLAHKNFYKQNWFKTFIKTSLGAIISLNLIIGALLFSILVRMLIF